MNKHVYTLLFSIACFTGSQASQKAPDMLASFFDADGNLQIPHPTRPGVMLSSQEWNALLTSRCNYCSQNMQTDPAPSTTTHEKQSRKKRDRSDSCDKP